MAHPQLVAAIEELYGATPDEFVRTRTHLVKAARARGERDLAAEIGELRKPTLPAWALNRLVRERPVEITSLLDLARRMREAQGSLEAGAMRALRSERESRLDSVTRAARFVADTAGHSLSMAHVAAIRSTCVAALADEAASEALASGALVRTLEYAGFGEVDLDDAIAAADTRRARTSDEGDGDDAANGDEVARHGGGGGSVEEALRRRFEEDLAVADRELARASLVEAEAVRLLQKAREREAELRTLLDAAEEQVRSCTAHADSAREERSSAEVAHRRARRRLDALTDESA